MKGDKHKDRYKNVVSETKKDKPTETNDLPHREVAYQVLKENGKPMLHLFEPVAHQPDHQGADPGNSDCESDQDSAHGLPLQL